MKLLLAATAALALTGCGTSKQRAAMKAIAYTKFLPDSIQEVWIARPDGSRKHPLAVPVPGMGTGPETTKALQVGLLSANQGTCPGADFVPGTRTRPGGTGEATR